MLWKMAKATKQLPLYRRKKLQEKTYKIKGSTVLAVSNLTKIATIKAKNFRVYRIDTSTNPRQVAELSDDETDELPAVLLHRNKPIVTKPPRIPKAIHPLICTPSPSPRRLGVD